MGNSNGTPGIHIPQVPTAMEPVATVTINMLPNGQITMTSTKNDPIYILGLLEMAKATVTRRAIGEPSPIVSAVMR